ncbi:MAG: hypothetical protein BWZ10_00613 [candidate division BRC1 bacterium ADurb.BinA364]|nr:MAG: hypothetical protein BWZ10_00613 [candidate division BRC1 bacterium ADurb.BinA364]
MREILLKDIGGESDRKAFDAAWAVAGIAWQKPIALAITDVRADNSPPMPRIALLIDLGADRAEFAAKLDALLTELAAKLGEGAETRRTVGTVETRSFRLDESATVTLGYLGETFFATFGDGLAEELVQLKPDASLRANKAFAAAMQEVGGENEQLSYYVDVESLKAKLLPPAPAGEVAASEPHGQEPHPRAILDALGVGRLSAIAGSVRIVDRGMYTRTRIFSPAPHQGLLMLLTGGTLNDADLSDVPADADFVLACKLSPSAALAELRRIVRQVEPEAEKELDEALAQADKAIGASLEKDLLAALSDTWVVSSAASQGGFFTGTMLTVSVKDADKLNKALAAIESAVVAAQPNGVKALTVKAGRADVRYLAATVEKFPLPVAPAWCVHKDKLHVALWPQVIVSDVENAGRNPLVKSEAFAAVRQKVSAKGSMLCYVNTPAIVRQLYPLSLLGGSMGTNFLASQGGAEGGVLWPLPMSRLEKYLTPEVSVVSFDDKGITLEGYSAGPSLTTGLPAVAALGTSISLPALGRARQTAKQTVSASNLHSLSVGMIMYAADNGGRLPPDLDAVVKPYLGSNTKLLVSPLSGRPEPRLVDGKIVGEIDYVFVCPGIKMIEVENPAEFLMLYEHLENYDDAGTNAAFVDGHVAHLSREEFFKALEKTKAALKKTPETDKNSPQDF